MKAGLGNKQRLASTPSRNTFPHTKSKETISVLLTSKEAVRIRQEAQAPAERDVVTSEVPFSSQSLGFSADKVTRKKD